MNNSNNSGSLAYPDEGTLSRVIYKLPLFLWRLGFGPFLSHPSRGGRKMMVVTTLGRKSGLPRHTMVSGIDYNQRNYAVSGWWLRSDWVKNFHENPLVTVQAGMRIYAAHARRVEELDEFRGVARALLESGGDSHFEEWLEDLQIGHDVEDLVNNRERVHFVGFDPVEMEGPDPLSADLMWIWAVLISLLLGLVFFLW